LNHPSVLELKDY